MPNSKKESHLTQEQEKIINSGSWGALFNIWYLMGMHAWTYLWIGLVVFILGRFLLDIPNIILIVYLVIKGKKIAWETRKWSSFENFLSTQRGWDRCAKIVYLIFVPLLIAFVIWAGQ